MKTIRQHLSELPYPINEMALKEVTTKSKRKYKNLDDALMIAFRWSNSELGIDFWWGIEDNLIHLDR